MKHTISKIIAVTLCYFLGIAYLRMGLWQHIDASISLVVIANRSNELTTFFTFITHLADSKMIVLLLAVAAVILGLRKEWYQGLRLIATSAFCSGVNSVMKQIVHRARPPFEHLVHETSLSFPSGHSSASFSFYGTLLLYLLFQIKNRFIRHLLIWATIILVLLIGFSRIYLGVHWFSDILAGYLTAAYSMYVVYQVIHAFEHPDKVDPVLSRFEDEV